MIKKKVCQVEWSIYLSLQNYDDQGGRTRESEQSEVKVQQINRTDDKKKNHPSSTHTQMRKLFFSQCDKKKCQADE